MPGKSAVGNPNPLKVMILSMEYTPEVSGGVGTYVLELSRGLAEAECQVCVLSFNPGKAKTLREPNLTAHLISASAASFPNAEKQSMAGSILAFNNDLVKKGQEVIGRDGWAPDIIQCYSWLTFQAARELGKTYGVPVLSVIQYVSEPVERWWGQIPDQEIVQQEKILFRDCGTFITVSNSMKRIIRETYGTPEDRVHVVYNGMNPQLFINPTSKSDVIRQFREALVGPNEKVVVFAGRLHPHKGIAALLDSASQVVEKYPGARYLLVGAPDSREFSQKMQSMLDQHRNLRDKIVILGKVPRNQLAAIYQVADMALVPSIYEPFGYASIEAMAAGVPVIATNAGGLAEIISDRQTGMLVPVHRRTNAPHVVDVEALTSAQLTLLNDEEMAKRLGLAGRQRVLELFNCEAMVRATIGVYRKAISGFLRDHGRQIPESAGSIVHG